jgi:hypothetical protein
MKNDADRIDIYQKNEVTITPDAFGMFDIVETHLPPRVSDITGRKFGFLTSITFGHSAKHRRFWWFRCDCGNYKLKENHHLTEKVSCGSKWIRNVRKAFHQTIYRHGLSGTRLDYIFRSMKQRCYNPSKKSFKDYGQRGITICEEWLQDRTKFFKWALDNGYSEGLFIDRRNNDEGYSPQNCRWVTRSVNNNNKRNHRYIAFDGQTLNIAQWERKLRLTGRHISKSLLRGHAPELIIAKILAKSTEGNI